MLQQTQHIFLTAFLTSILAWMGGLIVDFSTGALDPTILTKLFLDPWFMSSVLAAILYFGIKRFTQDKN